MSEQFFAKLEEDPRNIFYEEQKDINVLDQLKEWIPFQLSDKLKKKGQNTLLEISDSLGAVFFAFGPELIVLKNEELNQVLSTGKLNIDKIKAQGKNQTDGNPIIFLKVSDVANKLFVQHHGSEHLIVANLSDVLANPKQALNDASRVQMDLGSVDVRQMSIAAPIAGQKLATVVTRSTTVSDDDKPAHRLLLINYESATVVKREDDITTAVFSAQGSHIIAGRDSTRENLLVFDLNLQQTNAIKLSFPSLNENIEVDEYRVFFVGEPHKNNFIVFAAYYENDNALQENLGRTIMFWIGDDLSKPGLTLESLKGASKIQACFWEFDHQDDNMIPSFDLQWFENPASNEVIGMAMQSHADQPHQFKIKDGKLEEYYELITKNQFINRPNDPETDEVMDAIDTLGLCLGFKFLRTKMHGAPESINYQIIIDEGPEDLPYPVTLLIYSLNGIIKQNWLFTTDWRKTSLLQKPKPLPQARPPTAAANKQLAEEEKKQAPKSLIIDKSSAKPAQMQPKDLSKVEKPVAPAPAQPSMVKPLAIGQTSATAASSIPTVFKPNVDLSKPLGNSLASSASGLNLQKPAGGIFSMPAKNSPFQPVSNPFGSSTMPVPDPKTIAKPQDLASAAKPFGSGNSTNIFSNPNNKQQPAPVAPPQQPDLNKTGFQTSPIGVFAQRPDAAPSGMAAQKQEPVQRNIFQTMNERPVQIMASPKPVSITNTSMPLFQNKEQKPTQPVQIQNKQSIQQPQDASSLKAQAPQPAPAPAPKSYEQRMAEIFNSFTSEQKLAFTHSNNFTDVYNEQVVAKMNELAAQFPDKNFLMDEMQSKINGFLQLLKSVDDQSELQRSIKEMISQTQRVQLAMISQQHLCDRLKREAKYNIIGDETLSVANPSSELMKLCKTYRQFIKDSGYSEEDKEILMEIFESGNQMIQTAKRINGRLLNSENLQNKYSRAFQDKTILSDPQAQGWQSVAQQSTTRNNQMLQQLLGNIGIIPQQADNSRVSAQIYTNESTKLMREKVQEIESQYWQVQAKIGPAESTTAGKQIVDEPAKTRSTCRYGDSDDEAEDDVDREDTAFSESEMKLNDELVLKKNSLRAMVQDRARQKKFQKSLIQQFTAKPAPICKLEIKKPEEKSGRHPQIKVEVSGKSPALQKYEGSRNELQKMTMSQADKSNQQEMIARFCNVENKKQEGIERAQWISSLDKALITSPNQSPKPKNQLRKLTESVAMADPQQLKPLQSSVVGTSGTVKPQQSYAIKSFGSKTSDALQTQISSKIAQLPSFGEDPKGMISVSKNQNQLDQISENESPKKQPANPFMQASSGVAEAKKNPLKKQGTMSKLDINVSVKDAPKKVQTPAENSLGSKPTGAGQGLFDSLSISKKPATAAEKPQLFSSTPAVEQKQDKGGLFSGPVAKNLFGAVPKQEEKDKEGEKKVESQPTTNNLFGAPKANPTPAQPVPAGSLFGSSLSKPASNASNQPDAKPETKPSLFGSQPLAKASTGFGQAQPFSQSFLGQAQLSNTAPTSFGSVDITSKKPTNDVPQVAFGGGAFGGASASQKPISFSQASAASGGAGGAAGSVLKFGNSAPAPGGLFGAGTAQQHPPAGGIFGANSQQPLAFGQPTNAAPLSFGQPAPQQQPFSFGGQPQPMGMGMPAFQGLSGGSGVMGGQKFSQSMLKPRK